MKKRNLIFVTILSIITLGIYCLYWAISTRKELVAKGYKVTSIWKVYLYPIVGLAIAVGLGFVGTNASLHGSSDASILNALAIAVGFAAIITGFVLGIKFLTSYCRAVESVTNGGLTFGFNLAMAILLTIFSVGFIWIILVQYHFNKVGSATGAPAAQPQAGGSVYPNPQPAPTAAPQYQPPSPPQTVSPPQTPPAPPQPPAQPMPTPPPPSQPQPPQPGTPPSPPNQLPPILS